MADKEKFSFAISLSVLNHLGRNLYRSFATVLGEAISNSWDADSDNVWIYINKDENSFFIKDDGDGMTADEFQNKFLKIGYSKRKDGASKSAKKRPYIGRKGIGKLALLSCAEKISVITKTKGGEYVGGVIDNSGLDKAIVEDMKPEEYPLEELSIDTFAKHIGGHDHGTIIYFENIKDGIKNSLKLLKKILAYYFRFSLLDPSFSIRLNDEIVDHEALSDLAEKTEFLWTVNGYTDPYVDNLKKQFTKKKNEEKNFAVDMHIGGFIASVEKPSNLNIMNMGERVGVDIFVNGRMRERNITKHNPTSQIPESYLYGQIHYDELDDDDDDRFTSSRESIVADDPKFNEFLNIFRQEIVLKVVEDWDIWRQKHRKDGDSENETITPKERKSRELFNAVTVDYELPEESPHAEKVNGWVDALSDDAQFNFGSYAECFVSENLIRNFIEDKKFPLSPEAQKKANKWKEIEEKNKKKGNISIDVRQRDNEIGYLSMDGLANLVDKKDPNKEACLSRDAGEYKPIRDAVAHTSLLTDAAKNKLTSVYENIKGRVRALLAEEE